MLKDDDKCVIPHSQYQSLQQALCKARGSWQRSMCSSSSMEKHLKYISLVVYMLKNYAPRITNEDEFVKEFKRLLTAFNLTHAPTGPKMTALYQFFISHRGKFPRQIYKSTDFVIEEYPIPFSTMLLPGQSQIRQLQQIVTRQKLQALPIPDGSSLISKIYYWLHLGIDKGTLGGKILLENRKRILKLLWNGNYNFHPNRSESDFVSTEIDNDKIFLSNHVPGSFYRYKVLGSRDKTYYTVLGFENSPGLVLHWSISQPHIITTGPVFMNILSLSRPSHQDQDVKNDCQICLEPMTPGNLTVLTCKHKFHEECINTWVLNKHYRQLCPFCKTNDKSTKRRMK